MIKTYSWRILRLLTSSSLVDDFEFLSNLPLITVKFVELNFPTKISFLLVSAAKFLLATFVVTADGLQKQPPVFLSRVRHRSAIIENIY